jgi:hypothetical protein
MTPNCHYNSERVHPRRRLIRQLWVEYGASEADIARVDAVFAKYGLPAQAAEGYPLTGGPPVAIQWIVYVVLATPIGAFFASFGSEAGKDAYGAVKAWVQDLAAARQATGTAWQGADPCLRRLQPGDPVGDLHRGPRSAPAGGLERNAGRARHLVRGTSKLDRRSRRGRGVAHLLVAAPDHRTSPRCVKLRVALPPSELDVDGRLSGCAIRKCPSLALHAKHTFAIMRP